jgi:hypothetical protein
MSRRGIRLRPVWEDQYTLPQRADLLSPLPRQQRVLVDLIRERVLALPSVEEVLSWRGIPWRWAFGYSMEGEADRPFAYLIPCPVKPMFSMPFTAEQCRRLTFTKLSRPVRDSISGSMQVAGVRWPQWELTSKTLADELLTLARKRHELLLAPA